MLSSGDKSRMELDVVSIIKDWSAPIDIHNIAPIERQPGWNPIMREIVGEVVYDIQIGILAERRDVKIDQLDTNVAADRRKSECVLMIPSSYNTEHGIVIPDIRDDSMFIIDGDAKRPWRIKFKKSSPCEHIINVIQMVGGD